MRGNARPALGIVLLGCGAAARQYHLRELLADPMASVIALADPSDAAREAAQAPERVLSTADPAEAIGAPGVEAAVIAASTPAHEDLARAAMEGGLHVYVEKPIALDVPAARSLAELGRASGRVCAAGFNYRLNPAFESLRSRVREGEIGRIRSVETSFREPGSADPPPWRRGPASGGGVLLDLGSHEIDMLRWLLGCEVGEVGGAIARSELTTWDEAEFDLRMEDGTAVVSRLSYRAGREHRWLLHGERGTPRLDRWPPRVSARRRGITAALERRVRDSPFPRREPSFRAALRAFVRAGLGATSELATLEDGVRSLAAVEALGEGGTETGMRVLLVSDRGRNPGGTERYLAELAAALRAGGDDVRILAGVPSGPARAAAAGTIGSMAPPDVSVTDPRGPARVVTQVVNPGAVAAMRREIREFRPDAVHAAMVLSHLSPAVIGPVGGIPTTLLVTDHRFACPVGTKLLPGGGQCRRPAGRACVESRCVSTARAARDGLRQALLRRNLANVDRTLACSRHMAVELAGVGIEASHLALPVRRPSPSPPRAPSPEPVFVYGGRLAAVKGVDDLLKAFAAVAARVPAAQLVICGDGPDRAEIERRTCRPGLAGRVSMQPQMSLDWTSSLAAATALVAPSRFREPLGLSVIEAILRGVPVLATREGGHAESVEEGVSGVLVDNGDVRALTEAMAALCAPRSSLPAIVPDAARERLARRHDPDAHIASLRSIWTSGDGPGP